MMEIITLKPGICLTFSDDFLTEPVFDGSRTAFVESAHIGRCDDIDILTICCRNGYLIHVPCDEFDNMLKVGKIVIHSS